MVQQKTQLSEPDVFGFSEDTITFLDYKSKFYGLFRGYCDIGVGLVCKVHNAGEWSGA